MPNLYLPVKSILEEVITESPTIKTFVIAPEGGLSFEAGQFVEVTIPGVGEAPFTPSSSPSDGAHLALTVMKAGRVTGLLHEMEPGVTLGLRGAYGNAYPLDKFDGRDILILGGGVGLAPLRSLIHALLESRERFGRIILCYGARTPDDMIYKKQVRYWLDNGVMEVHLTVDTADDEWSGKVGVVTKALDDVTLDTGRTLGVVCGPPIMMKFGTQALLAKGLTPGSVYLSMERNMSCGIGQCGHCRLGPYYVCKDGPVFSYAQLEGVEDLW